MNQADLIEWARAEAERLRALGNGAGEGNPVSLTSSALQFLNQVAPGSAFVESAQRLMSMSIPSGNARHRRLTGVANVLEEWARYAEGGMMNVRPFTVEARALAADDLVEQAADLLSQPGVVPAVGVMLAGAALEEILRGMYEALPADQQTATGSGSISKYAAALRKADLIDKAAEREALAIGDRRNEAAHGQFDKISEDAAALLLDRVRFFLRQMA